MSESTPLRPGGVTVVAVAVWVSGAINVITGVLLLFQTGNTERVNQFGGTGPLIAFGAALAIRAVTLIVAGGLFRGSNGARIVVTIFQVLSVGAAIFLSLAAPWLLWIAVFSILVSIAALALLYVGKASEFFNA